MTNFKNWLWLLLPKKTNFVFFKALKQKKGEKS